MSSTFHIKINGGKEQVITTKTGMYHLAAAVALAQLEFDESGSEDILIEIWSPTLIPEYGPYFYRYDHYNLYPFYPNSCLNTSDDKAFYSKRAKGSCRVCGVSAGTQPCDAPNCAHTART